MPSSSCHRAPIGLSFSRIQKFIPKKWKRSINLSETENELSPNPGNCFKSNIETLCDDFMVDSLFASVKDYSGKGKLFQAFRTFSRIQSLSNSSQSSDIVLLSISSLLLSCSNKRTFSPGKQLHAFAISSGFEDHPVLVPKLINFYSAFNLLTDAHVIAETSKILHSLPWNLLICSYVRNGLPGEALSAYRQMVKRGIKPDNFTYPSILKVCGDEQNLDLGKEIHWAVVTGSLSWCVFVQNALVSMYGKCGDVDMARMVFDKMPERDAVSWNSMISAYASKGMWEEAFLVFESMRKEDIELNIVTWNTIAGGCLKIGNYEGALGLISQMRDSGINLDPVALLTGLAACARNRMPKVGKEIHCVAIRSYFDEFDNIKNAIITMYARCKYLRHAYSLFSSVETKSLINWNSIISGFAFWDCSEEASFLFRDMLLSGIEPNFVTIASIIPLCARVANLQHGKEFHCYITRHAGFEDYLLLWNALIDMYARSGKVILAERLFNMLRKKDEVTYTSLIDGYGTQGEGRRALELFEEMVKFQIKPDHVTMVAVLSACSHSGLVTWGQMLFENMQRLYGVKPRLEHYGCMVDLFGRAGLVEKAKEIISTMPFQPTALMWATLIGACRKYGNMRTGEWAAAKLLEVKPKNPGYYVLIANMYAAAGCWNKLAKVRTLMRDFDVQKGPGCAWVDIGKGFSSFSVEDTSNPQSDEVYPLLGGLSEQMKDAGYVVAKDIDLDDQFEEIEQQQYC